jgi:hypothetical protein
VFGEDSDVLGKNTIPPDLPWFDYPNSIRWTVPIT